MIYMKRDGTQIRTNDETSVAKFEADGFVRLTRWQVFWQVIMLNGTIDWLLPVVVATVVFECILSHDALGFIVGAWCFAFAQQVLSPLKIWD